MYTCVLKNVPSKIFHLINRYGEVYAMTYKDPILLKQVREVVPEETNSQ